MKPINHINQAWRGLVVDGEVVAWPTMLLDHNQAFVTVPSLRKYSARWRQWGPGQQPEFDRGASAEDQALVVAWLEGVGALG